MATRSCPGDTLDRPLQLRGTTSNSGTANDRLARLPQIFGLLAVLAAGFWLRSLSPGKTPFSFAEWPWARTATVTLYFSDGQSLFPVSRRVPVNTELPSAVLRALLAGPDARSSLKSWIPYGTEIRSFDLAGEVARILLPEVADGLAPPLGIGLVPDVDVTVDEGGNVGHGGLLVRTEMPHPTDRRDDMRGNCQ